MLTRAFSTGISWDCWAAIMALLGGLNGGLHTSAGPRCCGNDGCFRNAAGHSHTEMVSQPSRFKTLPDPSLGAHNTCPYSIEEHCMTASHFQLGAHKSHDSQAGALHLWPCAAISSKNGRLHVQKYTEPDSRWTRTDGAR